MDGTNLLTRESLRVGMVLWQGPHGENTYVVQELRKDDFVLLNRRTGAKAFEAYNWLYMYRELVMNGGGKYHGDPHAQEWAELVARGKDK